MTVGTVTAMADHLVMLGCCRTGNAWLSADGISWTAAPRPIAPPSFARELHTQPIRWKDRFLTTTGGCIGESDILREPAIVWESSDLLTWRRLATLPTAGAYCVEAGEGSGRPAIAVIGGRLVIAGSAHQRTATDLHRAVVFSSVDGRHWRLTPLSPWGQSGGSFIVRAAGGVYVFGYGGPWRSRNGRTWTRLRPNIRLTDVIEAIPGGPGLVATVGDPEGIIVSATGRAWRMVQPGGMAAANLPALVRAGSIYVATPADVWISSDAIHWQVAASFPGISGFLSPVVWYHGHLIAFVTSADNESVVTRALVSPPVPGEELVPSK